MPITALYASLLVPFFLLLASRVIRARRGASVAVGDGGNAFLMRRMRVHANFAEYVPLALLLMALAEGLGTSNWLLHALGIALLGGRLVHAFGMFRSKRSSPSASQGWSPPSRCWPRPLLPVFMGRLPRALAYEPRAVSWVCRRERRASHFRLWHKCRPGFGNVSCWGGPDVMVGISKRHA